MGVSYSHTRAEPGRSTESVHLEIYGYRSWNHIPFYYIVREWRAIAMAFYGKPIASGTPLDLNWDWQIKYKIGRVKPAFILLCPTFMKRVRSLVVHIRYPAHMLDDSDLSRYPGFSRVRAWKQVRAPTPPQLKWRAGAAAAADPRRRLSVQRARGVATRRAGRRRREKARCGERLFQALRRFKVRKTEWWCTRLNATRCRLLILTAILKDNIPML
ncbi:hypothetical protein DL769_003579 [Monosporascus sp. CRB-8-3]|nr:hypothetical protein DL769_003579 [Monosporascus sp. CRB-8-3]